MTQILLLTAYDDHERAQVAKRIFGPNFLEKKNVGDGLVNRVQKILGERNVVDET